jgi:hypothetical protein
VETADAWVAEGKKGLWRRKSVANQGKVLYHKWFLQQALIPHGRYPGPVFSGKN